MSQILCGKEPVSHPFYFDGLGVQLYSSQELCYVIYNHPLLVMEDFVDGNLIEFIREELGLVFLAAKLEKWQQSGENPDELLFLILSDCDYYNSMEIRWYSQQLEGYRRLALPELTMAKADYLFSRKQYGKAVTEYERIADMGGERSGDEAFFAKAYHNLGASYARLFSSEKAYQAYQKSFDLVKNGEALKRIYYLSRWNPSLVLKERIRSLITDEAKAAWEEEFQEAQRASEQAGSLKELKELFAEDPIKRLAEASRLVQRWKLQYRGMI